MPTKEKTVNVKDLEVGDKIVGDEDDRLEHPVEVDIRPSAVPGGRYKVGLLGLGMPSYEADEKFVVQYEAPAVTYKPGTYAFGLATGWLRGPKDWRLVTRNGELMDSAPVSDEDMHDAIEKGEIKILQGGEA